MGKGNEKGMLMLEAGLVLLETGNPYGGRCRLSFQNLKRYGMVPKKCLKVKEQVQILENDCLRIQRPQEKNAPTQ